MYVSINKKWFEENKERFARQDSEEKYYEITDVDGTVEMNDMNEGKLSISEDADSKIYISLSYQPSPDVIVSMVEEALDDIKGDAFAKIIELVVKKLNKFKSLIESVRGL